MPASIGLTHLRVRTKPRHTFAERLAALEKMDEEERETLARQWRNTTARDPPPSRPTMPSNSDRPWTSTIDPSSLVVVGGTGGHQRLTQPKITTTPPAATTPKAAAATTTSSGPAEISQFLSPPTTRIRGPMSYTEDPRQRRQQQNEYLQYFQSSLHDDIIALQLAAQTSKKTSRREQQGRHRDKGCQERDAANYQSHHISTAVDYDDDLGFSPAARRQSPSRSRSPHSHDNSMSGQMSSLMSLHGVDSAPMHLPKFHTGGCATPGAAGDSTSRRSLLPGSKSNRATSRSGNEESVAHAYASEVIEEGCRPSLLPDHVPDPERLRRFRSRYQPGRVDVSSLKPKCAVLHVKLEKISRRMKAEDDEFRVYRDAYLRTLR